MQDPIISRSRVSHFHKWNLAQIKNNFEHVGNEDPDENTLYKMVEYAYMICNGCSTIAKVAVQDKDSML